MAARRKRKHARSSARGSGKRSFSRWLERLAAGNPFAPDCVKTLLVTAAFLAVYAVLARCFHLRLPSVVFLAFAGPLSVRLAASLLRFSGYQKWKKTHRGKALRKDVYLREQRELAKIMGNEHVWNMMDHNRRR